MVIVRVSWLTMLGACGRLGFDAGPTSHETDACIAESAVELCARLAKTCEPVTAIDNCGDSRVADCGSCVAPTTACVANVCTAPVCADGSGAFAFAASGTPIASLSVSGVQEAMLGASTSGTTVLMLRASSTPACVGFGSALFVADDSIGTGSYVLHGLSGVANLASFVANEETMTISGDGLTIVGVDNLGRLASASRSAIDATDFATPSVAMFDAVNASIPAGGGVSWPVLAVDGLALSFTVAGAAAGQNGIYEAVRASTSVAFSAAVLMTGDVQSYLAISGISTDGMTAFVATSTYSTEILTRTSSMDTFAAPVPAPSAPGNAWRVVPIAGCAKVIGTCEPGGCTNEDICVWGRQ
jgi:hypothetical protein